MEKKWIVEKSELVLDNKWVSVRRDTCLLPTGKTIDDYYLWLGNDFAMVFGLTKDNQVVLVKQYKHGAQDIVVELPAGLVSDSDHNPQAAAARELMEETGYEAENYTHLMSAFTASSKATTIAHLYLATGLVQVANPEPSDQEIIENFCVPIPKLMGMIEAGEIQDVNSIAATFLALQKLGHLSIAAIT